MTPHVARIYDLDGTLVRLAVDWDRVRADLVEIYGTVDLEIEAPWGVWDLLSRADEHGLRDPVEETIARHERDGARRSERLPAADELGGLSIPAAVCSLNAEAACRIALDRHGLSDAVDVIIGRDTVGPVKPDPAPLLAAVQALGVEPSDALYIGNREKDAITARRAGVPFTYVGGDGPTE